MVIWSLVIGSGGFRARGGGCRGVVRENRGRRMMNHRGQRRYAEAERRVRFMDWICSLLFAREASGPNPEGPGSAAVARRAWIWLIERADCARHGFME